MPAGDPADWVADIAGIQTEILLVVPSRDFRTLHHDPSQCPIQKLGVVHVGAADDDRQRESMAVDQQAAFASFFSPGRSGSGLHTGLPEELFPSPRRLPATARLCRACRHTRPVRPARASGKIPPRASSENTDAPRWPSRTRRAMLSIECRCAERKPWPRKPAAQASACVPLQPCAGTSSPLSACASESAVPPCSTNHPTLSTT